MACDGPRLQPRPFSQHCDQFLHLAPYVIHQMSKAQAVAMRADEDLFSWAFGYVWYHAHRGYMEFERLLSMCLEMVADCDCENGCPSCVGLSNLRPPLHQDPDLGAGWTIPSKEAALIMLRWLLK